MRERKEFLPGGNKDFFFSGRREEDREKVRLASERGGRRAKVFLSNGNKDFSD